MKLIEMRARLTPREREVLDHILAGLDSRYIAEQLGVEVSTVRQHYKSIFAKLAVESRHQIMAQVIDELAAAVRGTAPLKLTDFIPVIQEFLEKAEAQRWP